MGKMGAAIAARLAEETFDVIGWDADPSRLKQLAESGQRAAGSAREVAETADIIVSIISDDHGVRKLFLGPGGFLETDVAGKIFLEMSTVQPKTAVALAPAVSERGAAWIDAPVMGTIPSARSGRLLALAGGSAHDIARAEPVLSVLTRRVVHVGPPGSGYATKLSVNLLMAAYLQALAESLSLASRSGIPADLFLEILQESPVASPWLKTKLPFFLGQEGPPSLDIRTLRKDVNAAVASGADLGVAMPGASAVLAALSAAVAHGEGENDLADHVRFFMENMVQEPRFE